MRAQSLSISACSVRREGVEAICRIEKVAGGRAMPEL
jgi:hypothetical protein